MKQATHDALLVVVGNKSRATIIASSLSLRGIESQVRQNVGKIVEFGGQLGIAPFEIYVRSEDLAHAKRIVEGVRPVDGGGRLDVWPST